MLFNFFANYDMGHRVIKICDTFIAKRDIISKCKGARVQISVTSSDHLFNTCHIF